MEKYWAIQDKYIEEIAFEPKSRKNEIYGLGICTLVVYAVIGGLYYVRQFRADKLQDAYEDSESYQQDVIYYDVAPFLNPGNTWSDPEEAQKLIDEIGTDWSLEDGCRWTVIYYLNGMALCLIAMNAIFQMLGATMWNWRMTSDCFGFCFWVTEFAAIIVTAVFRFNSMGQLVALSNTGTEYTGGQFTSVQTSTCVILTGDLEECPPVTGRTYVEEANWIVGLWVCQMLWFLCGSSISIYIQKIRKPLTDDEFVTESLL